MLPFKPCPNVYFKINDSFNEELGIEICSAHLPSSTELTIEVALIYQQEKVVIVSLSR